MTARLVRPFAVQRQRLIWRLLLDVIVLIVTWLVLFSAAAAQVPPLQNFDPQEFWESMFGKAVVDLDDEKQLAKVEIGWDEEVRLGQQLLDGFERRMVSERRTSTKPDDVGRYLTN